VCGKTNIKLFPNRIICQKHRFAQRKERAEVTVRVELELTASDAYIQKGTSQTYTHTHTNVLDKKLNEFPHFTV